MHQSISGIEVIVGHPAEGFGDIWAYLSAIYPRETKDAAVGTVLAYQHLLANWDPGVLAEAISRHATDTTLPEGARSPVGSWMPKPAQILRLAKGIQLQNELSRHADELVTQFSKAMNPAGEKVAAAAANPWEQIKSELEYFTSQEIYSQHIEPLKVREIRDNTIVLETPKRGSVAWLELRLKTNLENRARIIAGEPVFFEFVEIVANA